MSDSGHIQFDWDEAKDKTNIRKHRVSFLEATSVFLDKGAILIADPGHSEHEDRFLLIGLSAEARMIVVSHCYRNGKIRIISARKATTTELSTLPG